jgi:hypothetical protein
MAADLEALLFGFGADMGVDLAFDEPGGFSAEVVEEVFEGLLVALGFEHDGAVGLVADPPGDHVACGDGFCPSAEPHALDAPLEDHALTGHHGGIVVGMERLCALGRMRVRFDRTIGVYMMDWAWICHFVGTDRLCG